MLGFNLLSLLSTQSLGVICYRALYELKLHRLILATARNNLVVEMNRDLSLLKYKLKARQVTSIWDGSTALDKDAKVWILNGARYQITDDFLNSEIDKGDYTPRFIYMYLNWLPNFADKFGNESAKRAVRAISRSPVFKKNPSINSISAYPLVYMYLKSGDFFYLRALYKISRNLIISTEEYIGANHLFDNFLTLYLLGEIFNYDRVKCFAFNKICKSFTHWQDNGFIERNKCYEILIAQRINFIVSIIENSNLMHVTKFKEIIECLVKKTPNTYANDCYLPFSHLEMVSSKNLLRIKSADYGINKNDISNINFLKDVTPKRGGFGHAHDSDYTIYDVLFGYPIHNNLGTPTYRMSHLRNIYSSRLAYSTFTFLNYHNFPAVYRFLPFRVIYNPLSRILNIINYRIVKLFFEKNNEFYIKIFLYIFDILYIDIKIERDFPINKFFIKMQDYSLSLRKLKITPVRRYDGIESEYQDVLRLRATFEYKK